MGTAQASAPTKSVFPASTHRYRTQAPKILVVDDEPAVSGVLRKTLQDRGYEVFVAANGREGLDILKSNALDGIILDLNMPVMDGYTMLDELRWQGNPTPVIVMSEEGDGRVLRTLLKEGAQGFLLKPFPSEALYARCHQCFVPTEKHALSHTSRKTKAGTGYLQRDVA